MFRHGYVACFDGLGTGHFKTLPHSEQQCCLLLEPTTILILSLSKHAEPHAWDHAAYQPLNSANCVRAKVFWLSVKASEALK
jgi:hypothetical protein